MGANESKSFLGFHSFAPIRLPTSFFLPRFNLPFKKYSRPAMQFGHSTPKTRQDLRVQRASLISFNR
jgi:hypothetical protein